MGSRMLWNCELDSLEASWQQQRSKYGSESPTDTVIFYKCLVNRNLYLITFTLSFTLATASIPQAQTFHSLGSKIGIISPIFTLVFFFFYTVYASKLYNSKSMWGENASNSAVSFSQRPWVDL